MAKTTTLLFDCDNTLVLSEKLAFEGCADLINSIFEAKGIPLEKPFTGPTLEDEFVGRNFRGMLVELRERYNLPVTDEELDRKPDGYVAQEEDVVIAKLLEKAEPCEGADAALERIAKSDKYCMAVVSSSALRRVVASIKKTGQDKYFGDRVYSAATSLPKPTSKPDPAVYLHALEKLGVKAENAVAIEDSKSGATAAVRAGIPMIGYVGPYTNPQKKAEMEKMLTEVGAKAIMRHWDEFESCLEKIEKS